MHIEMLISGHRIGGPCDQSVGKEIVRNPYDQSVVGTVAEGGWSELSTCLSAAHDAFSLWKDSSLEQRAQLLSSISKNIDEHKDELEELAVKEIGKPISLVRAELARTRLTFESAAVEALRLDAPSSVGQEQDISYDPRGKGAEAYVRRRPRGVIFAITPYNWPFNLTAHKIAPAIATGNTVVLKPSPFAAACTMRLAQIIHEAGCPDGVVNCWNGANPLVAKALRDERVKYLSFTGSAEVGWKLKQEHPRMPITLELGGNAPVIVCESADVNEAAMKIAMSAFSYSGQVCISAQNVFVAESCYDAFLAAFSKIVETIQPRDPSSDSMVMGPMIHQIAVEKVKAMVLEAHEAGATSLVTGSVSGNIFGPEVLLGVPDFCRLKNEEVFGPVVTVDRFDSLSGVVKSLNKQRNAIHAAAYLTDDSELAQVLELDYPGLVINDSPSLRFDTLPYGGERESGWGREGVLYAMREYTTLQSIVRRNT